jgi:hypothetical protein
MDGGLGVVPEEVEIAEVLSMPLSTVSGLLGRIGMGRLGLEPARRYERERPGELIHIDVKKLGRIHGGAGPGRLGSTEPIYGWDPDSPADPRSFARADHCDHIHVGWDG